MMKWTKLTNVVINTSQINAQTYKTHELKHFSLESVKLKSSIFFGHFIGWIFKET